MAVLNPYEGIDWSTVLRLGSATHMHMTNQETLENGYRYGIRHFPISNYYPSAPYGPDTRPSDFRLRQHWPARMEDGSTLAPPINWNDIITWREDLDEPFRSEVPFQEGGKAFTYIPDDAIISPNAEHHGFSNSGSHICSPGSAFISGNIDPKERYHLRRHGFCVGFGGTWQEAFEGMIGGLVYPDGGGITINHPTWFSKLPEEQVLEMLDFDEGVLGIEVYNDYSARRDWFESEGYEPPDESEPGFSLNLWDRILSTGRRCWGVSVPDHSVARGTNWNGRNVLLVSEFTEGDCLRAYRQGRFYGCLKDSGLTVTDLSATESAVSIAVNAAATIRFIAEAGIVAEVNGERATWEIPQKGGRPYAKYVRIEVEDDSGERLFLQPILYG
ncbi:MAG: hypothetical protein QGI83_16930 [Candidatus Latescibacteria bacterium]|jgi:hypothetical protein|nr:hypothetical protein [Candidatus Latescibacterota bacterium]